MKKYIFFFFLLILPVFACLIVFVNLVKIDDVTCQSQYGPCGTQILDVVSAARGKRVIDSLIYLRRTLSKNHFVQEYHIGYKAPSTINLSIIERKPKYALFGRNDQKSYLTDSQGLVLGERTTGVMPLLVGDFGNLVAGTTVRPDILFALEVFNSVFYEYGSRNAEVVDSSLKVALNNGIVVYFPLKGDKDVLMGSLKLVLGQLNKEEETSRMGDSTFSTVDLRFDKPIIK